MLTERWWRHLGTGNDAYVILADAVAQTDQTQEVQAEGAVGEEKDEEVHAAVGDGDLQQDELGERCGEGAEEHGGEESGVVGAPAQREQTQSHGDRPAAAHKHPPPDFITSLQQGCTQIQSKDAARSEWRALYIKKRDHTTGQSKT